MTSKLESWRQKGDLTSCTRVVLNPWCKTTFPSPGQIHGNSSRVCKNNLSENCSHDYLVAIVTCLYNQCATEQSVSRVFSQVEYCVHCWKCFWDRFQQTRKTAKYLVKAYCLRRSHIYSTRWFDYILLSPFVYLFHSRTCVYLLDELFKSDL